MSSTATADTAVGTLVAPPPRRWLGLAMILISAASFGATPIFARLAFTSGADTYTVLALRFGIAASCLLAFQAARRVSLPRGRVLAQLLLLGAIGRVAQTLTFFIALTLIPAALVSLLLYLYPAIVTLLAAVFLRDRMTPLKLVALVVALVGTVLTIGPATGDNPIGIGVGVLTACLYAVYILISSQITPKAGVLSSSTVITLAAAVVYCALAGLHGFALPQTTLGWLSILGLALISTVIGTLTFFAGLGLVGPTDASTLSTFEPVITVMLAAVILSETIQLMQLIGGTLILVAVIALARGRR